MTDFPIDRVRADTPGVDDHIHLNNAGSSLPPAPVVTAQIEYLRAEAVVGGYELADQRRDDIEATYGSLARLIGAGSDEIALTSNATESWQLAFHSVAIGEGDVILTGEASYASNYIGFLKRAEETGAIIRVAPSDDAGHTSVAAIEDMVDPTVKLIALTHVPTNGGLINPAAEVGAVARAAGVPYLLDACQSVGHLDLDVSAIGCDFLSATGRKFLRGPRGTGFLYVRRSMLERVVPPFLDLHGASWTATDRYVMRPDARRYENWEFNYASILGLKAAADYAIEIGMPAIAERIVQLGSALRDRIAAIDGMTVHDLGNRPGGIVTFSAAHIHASDIKAALSAARIAVSTTTPFSTRLDAERRGLPDMVRASVHYFTTEQELDATAGALAAL